MLARVVRDYELLFRGFYSELRHHDELSFCTKPTCYVQGIIIFSPIENSRLLPTCHRLCGGP